MMQRTFLFAAMMLALAAPAVAQDAAAPSLAAAPGVAVVNTVRVFNEMQQFKDLNTQLEQERKTLEDKSREYQQQLRELENQRNVLRADSPQYQEKQQEYLKKAIDYRAWLELTQQDQQRRYKIEMNKLFESMKSGIADYAAQNGIGVVIAQKSPDIELDKVNIEQLKTAILSADVLYVAGPNDITEAVITHLDARYKAGSTTAGN